jgi:hypothetical protein
MSETYEVNLLRNVQAVDSKSSVSKEFSGLKRKQARDNRRRKSGYTGRNIIPRVSGIGGYGNEAVENEQEGTIDITV